MNKFNTITKTAVVALACVAFCGTTFAYPLTGGHPAGAAMGGAPHGRGRPPAPMHHTPPPPPHPGHHHGGHHGGHHENAGWVTLGAAAIGGVVGGIIGACR